MTINNEIAHAFGKQAHHYDAHAKIQQEIGQRLIERLIYFKLQPRYILDLGCGTGYFSQLLRQRYPKAVIVGFDLASTMLLASKKKFSWRKKWSLVQGDMRQLPFVDGLFDLVFANQSIHWGGDLSEVLTAIQRVMNVGGCLMLSSLGPDTFKELHLAWQALDDFKHVNSFLDMHDIGDSLIQCGFVDPVMDSEYLQAHYPSTSALLKSLKAQGVRNMHVQRNPGLTGRRRWRSFDENLNQLKTASGKIPLTYEIIYGQAFKNEQIKTALGTEIRIPIARIGKL